MVPWQERLWTEAAALIDAGAEDVRGLSSSQVAWARVKGSPAHSPRLLFQGNKADGRGCHPFSPKEMRHIQFV